MICPYCSPAHNQFCTFCHGIGFVNCCEGEQAQPEREPEADEPRIVPINAAPKCGTPQTQRGK